MTGLFILLFGAQSQAADLSMGTYGRAGAATDLSGGEADTLDIVTYASRIGKGPYAEIDFVFEEEVEGSYFQITPAFAGQTFHYTGEWDADIAVRNLFAEGMSPRESGWSVWAGARMWRGDDVYLWDFWPMDNLNIVGGGGAFKRNGWELRAAIGLNRLTSGAFQQQSVTVQTPGGSATVEVLDRQRTVAACARVAWARSTSPAHRSTPSCTLPGARWKRSSRTAGRPGTIVPVVDLGLVRRVVAHFWSAQPRPCVFSGLGAPSGATPTVPPRYLFAVAGNRKGPLRPAVERGGSAMLTRPPPTGTTA